MSIYMDFTIEDPHVFARLLSNFYIPNLNNDNTNGKYSTIHVTNVFETTGDRLVVKLLTTFMVTL